MQIQESTHLQKIFYLFSSTAMTSLKFPLSLALAMIFPLYGRTNSTDWIMIVQYWAVASSLKKKIQRRYCQLKYSGEILVIMRGKRCGLQCNAGTMQCRYIAMQVKCNAGTMQYVNEETWNCKFCRSVKMWDARVL